MAKTKVLISCTVIVKLICVFVYTYAKSRIFHDAAHIKFYAYKSFVVLIYFFYHFVVLWLTKTTLFGGK